MLQTQTAPTMGKVFSFNGNEVTMRLQDGTVYVNLTEFAKPFPGKNLSTIINSQEIKDYCKALSEIKNFSSADLLIVSKGGDVSKQGTWAHQKVALRVAQKLSPDFAVWVDTKIEELLTTGVTTASDDDAAIAHAMSILQKRLDDTQRQLSENSAVISSLGKFGKSVRLDEMAVMLRRSGVRMSEAQLTEWLHTNKYLYKSSSTCPNHPTPLAMEKNIFEIKKTIVRHYDYTHLVSFTPKITVDGQMFLLGVFLSAKDK